MVNIYSVMNNAKHVGFPPKNSDNAMWIVGDAARHRNPLIDWIIDIVKNNKDHIAHAELILAWLFVQDSMKLAPEHAERLRTVTVRRLTELLITHRPLQELLVDPEASKLALDHLGQRVHASE